MLDFVPFRCHSSLESISQWPPVQFFFSRAHEWLSSVRFCCSYPVQLSSRAVVSAILCVRLVAKSHHCQRQTKIGFLSSANAPREIDPISIALFGTSKVFVARTEMFKTKKWCIFWRTKGNFEIE